MKITACEAEAVANEWSRMNGTVFGSFGTVDEVVEKKADDGSTLYFVCKMTGGSVAVAPDTDLNPIIGASHSRTSWDNDRCPMTQITGKDLRNRIGVIKDLASRGPSLKSGAGGSGDDGLSAAFGKANGKWSRLLGRTSEGGSGTKLAASPEEHRTARIYHVCDGWRKAAIGPDEPGRDITFWNQEEPYNGRCPDGCIVGCVAVAMTQVQHFYRCPSESSQFSEECTVNGSKRVLESIPCVYDWDTLMSDTDRMAKIAYNSGVAVKMGYGTDRSGAWSEDTVDAMVGHLGFHNGRYVGVHKDKSGMDTKTLDDSVIEDVLYPFLKNGRPVMLGISSNGNNGHEVVATGIGVDALGDVLTFVDVGWGGDGDAWYLLPAITTHDSKGSPIIQFNIVSEIMIYTPPGMEDKPVPITFKIKTPDGSKVDHCFIRVFNKLGGLQKYEFEAFDEDELNVIVDAANLTKYPYYIMAAHTQSGAVLQAEGAFGIGANAAVTGLYTQGEAIGNYPGVITIEARRQGSATAIENVGVPLLWIYDDSTGSWVQIPTLKGPRGKEGERGPTGPTGDPTASISIGQVKRLRHDQNPTVVNKGTSQSVVLEFGLPEGPLGPTGPYPQISVGTVTVGDNPAVTIDPQSTPSNVIFNFVLPRAANQGA